MSDCMAKDTWISMEDGSKKRIKDIRIGDRVMGSNHEISLVQNVWRGMEAELVRLRADRDCSIFLTDNHPVMTVDGWKRAGNLTPGIRVCTEEGDATLTDIMKERYDDTVYNLDLSNLFRRGERSMIADGFIVGDFMRMNESFE